MAESDPKKLKHLGCEVEDFDDKIWKGVCRDVIYKGNLAKFSQNPMLRDTLLKTRSKIIVEANPHECRYGQWRESNWLGEEGIAHHKFGSHLKKSI